ncbi:MAG: hypothetical protein H6747_01190 [Deltaproteobacteria bacterium]|nr:hypothetical protein [Deltaproteobacteria bacterium]
MPAARPRPALRRARPLLLLLALWAVPTGCGSDGGTTSGGGTDADFDAVVDAVLDVVADTTPVDAVADANVSDTGADAAIDTGADTGTDVLSDTNADADTVADTSADAVTDADADADAITGADTDAAAETDAATDPDVASGCQTAADCPAPAFPCQLAACTEGVCTTTTAADGDVCTSPSQCAATASCLAGNCVVLTLKSCDDANVCTADSCNPSTGACLHTPALDGAVCSDGSKCTLTATCFSGVCTASKAQSCDDGDPCTTDVCDPKSGACVSKPDAAGSPCDDGNVCTEGDTCDAAGTCAAGKAVCPCSTAADCASKDDGNPCNGTLFCDGKSGTCQINPLTVVSCPDTSDGICEVSACDPKTGGCAITPFPFSVGCDDGDSCTVGDVCDGQGACAAGAKICACVTDADCLGQDDGNPCNGTLYCDKTNAAGFACKVNPASIVSCAKNNDTHCSKNVCNPQTGTCSLVAQQNGLPCEDGEPCTKGDVCLAGGCKAGSDACLCKNDDDCALQEDGDLCNGTLFCNQNTGACDLNPATVVTCPTTDDTFCRVATCDKVTGGCKLKPTNKDKACDDGNACTKDEVCDLAGECTATINTCLCKTDDDCAAQENGNLCDGTLFCNQASNQCEVNPATVVTCPTADDSFCQVNTCLGKTGSCQLLPRNEGASCDADGNACTKDDACFAGTCKAGTNTCECQSDADCAAKEGLDLCSELYCNGLTHACEVNPATEVVCSKADDTLCITNQCNPATGKCNLLPRNEGLACDADGTNCTKDDACKGGVCTAGPNSCGCVTDADCKSQEDGNPCTGNLVCGPTKICQVDPATVVGCPSGNDTTCIKNLCDAKTGSCVMTPQNLKVICGPGTLCTGAALCDADGTCKAGQKVDCDDQDPCTADACNDSKGCVYTADSGGACDDGNVCTEQDVCVKGFCTGALKPCTEGTPCTIDSCHPQKGCQYDAKSGPCDDGNLCTEDESCVGKACVGKLVACNDGKLCTTDSCDAKKGCVFAPNTFVCNDGDLCTKQDRCKDGLCVGLPLQVSVDCSDDNPCTDEVCDKQKGCTFSKNTAPCDDGDPCSKGDACAAGVCTAGATAACDDGNACTADTCDGKTGACSHGAPSDPACDDGDPCSVGESCSDGTCAGGKANACDDDNVCTADACDSKTDKGCVHTPATGPACDDGNLCSVNDTCVKGSCAGTAKQCDGGTACTVDSCHPLKGCVYTARTGACDDGNACTGNDLCSGSQCVGKPLTCDDGNLCTDDACDPKQGCVALPNKAPCDDGDLCTKADGCKGGGCVGLPLQVSVDCEDGNACTTHGCDKASGCTTAKPQIPCDDGDPCTLGDSCNNGSCSKGAVAACNDGNACTTDACDKEKGCAFVDLPTSATCNDGQACTAKAVCIKGTCLQVLQLDCDDKDPCTADACNQSKGCTYSAATAGVPCDDGDACTTDSACSDGLCAGGKAISCDDGEACTVDACDKVKGCVHDKALEGSACATGVDCQVAGKCTQGVCAGAIRRAFAQSPTGGGGSCEDALQVADGTTLLVGSRTVDGKQRPLAMRMRFSGKTLAEHADTTLVGAYAAALTDGKGGYIAVGWRDAGLAGALDGTIGLLDASGKTVGRVGIGGLQNDRFYDIAKAPKGTASYVAVGSSVANSSGGEDGWFVGLDAAGKTVWQTTDGLVVADRAVAVTSLDDASYFVGVSGNQGWSGKLDAAGKLVWQKRDDGVVFADIVVDGGGKLLAAGRTGQAARVDEVAPADGKRTARFSWIRQFVNRPHTVESISPLQGGGVALGVFEYVASNQPALVHAIVLDAGYALRWQQQSPYSSNTAAVLGLEATSLMQVHSGSCALWRSDSFGHKACTDAGACHALTIPDCDDSDACTAKDWCDKGSCTHTPSKVCDDGSICTTDACDKKTGACAFTAVADQTPCNESSSACAVPGACNKGACVGARVSTWAQTINTSGWLSLPYSAIYWRTDVSRVGIDSDGIAIGAGHNRVSAYHSGGEQQHGTRLAMFRVDAEGKLTHNAGWVEKNGSADYFWHATYGLSRFANEQSMVLVKLSAKSGNNPPQQVRLVRTTGTSPSARWPIGDSNSDPRDGIADLAQPYAWSLLRDQHVNGNSGANAYVLYRTAVSNGATVRYSHLLGDLDNDPTRIDAVPGGGVVVAGRARSSADNAWHRAVARVAFDGNLSWKVLDDSSAGITDVAWTSAGPVVLGTQTEAVAGQNVTYLTFQAWDASGKPRWSRKHFPTTRTFAYALAGDGATVVASSRLLTTDASGTGDRLALIRVDAQGNVMGDARVPVDYSTIGTDASAGADGSVLLGYRNVGNYAGAMHLATPFLNRSCAADGKCIGKGLADCDDKVACTLDLCAGDTGCVHKSAGASALCDDGDLCTEQDACDSKDQCAGKAMAEGAPCKDAEPCKLAATCTSGKCVAKDKVCDDGKSCTNDACDPKTDSCAFSPVTDGTACSDQSPCHKDATCKAGACQGGTDTCDDGKPCTADTCNADGSCTHIAAAKGTSCNDGEACTATDVCDGAGGCKGQNVADDTACSDGKPCTGGGRCASGSCTVVSKSCDDGDGCTKDSCDPSNGACKHDALADGTDCADGDACITGASCKSGSCTGGTDACLIYGEPFDCGTDGKPLNSDWVGDTALPVGYTKWVVDGVPSAVTRRSGGCSLGLHNPEGGFKSRDPNGLGSWPQRWVTGPELDIPAGGAVVEFWQFRKFSSSTTFTFFAASLEVSADGFQTQRSYEIPRMSSGVWERVRIDLAEFAGKKVRLRFRAHSYIAGEFENTSGVGLLIEDLRVRTQAPCRSWTDCIAGDKCGAPTCTQGVCQRKTVLADGASCSGGGGSCFTGNQACKAGICRRDHDLCDDDNRCNIDRCSGGSCQSFDFFTSPLQNRICDTGKTCNINVYPPVCAAQ